MADQRCTDLGVDSLVAGAVGPPPSSTVDARGRRTCRWRCCPVRLETRFFPRPTASRELRVRVYPDKVHIDSHEPALTRGRARVGPSASGSCTGAPAHDEAAPARGLAHARRPLRPRARRLDRARAAPINPRTARHRSTADAAAERRRDFRRRRRPRRQRSARRWPGSCRTAGSPRPTPAGALVALATGRAVASPSSRSAPICRPSADRRRPTTRRRSTRACAGWSTSTDAEAAAWRCACRCRASRSTPASTCCSCSASGVDRGDGAGRARRAARRAPLHRRPGLPARRHADQQHRRPAAPAFSSADPRSAQLRRGVARAGVDRPAATPTALGAALGLDARCRAALARVGDAARDERCRAADGDRAVAGDLGLLPLADDRLRRHGPQPRRGRTGRAAHSIDARARRRSAAGAALRPPALRPAAGHVARRLGAGGRRRRRASAPPAGPLLLRLRDRVWRPRGRRGRRGSGAATTRRRPRRRAAHRRALVALSASAALMGRHYLQHLRAFLGEDLDAAGFWPRCRVADRRRLPAPARTRLAPAPDARRLRRQRSGRCTAPLVQAGDVGASRGAGAQLHPALLAARRASPSARPPPRCRPSCRRCCATRCCASTPRPPRRFVAERRARPRRCCATTSSSTSCAAPPPTPTWAAARSARRRRDGHPHGARVSRCAAEPGRPGAARPRRVSAALQRLAGLDTGDARSATSAGTLDAGLAPARRLDHLAGHAAGSPSCAHAGHWARGRRLRLGREPEARPRPAPPCRRRRRTSRRRSWRRADDTGFIHAPSLNQAATAALLRNGHLSSRRQRANGPLRHRPVVGARPARPAAARRRAPGPAARGAARLPLRAAAARAPARRAHRRRSERSRRGAARTADGRRAAGGRRRSRAAAATQDRG